MYEDYTINGRNGVLLNTKSTLLSSVKSPKHNIVHVQQDPLVNCQSLVNHSEQLLQPIFKMTFEIKL